jgi:hypothetical protein
VNYVDTQGAVSERRAKKLMMEIAELREQLKSTTKEEEKP